MSEQTTRTRSCPSADDVIATLRAHEAELRAAGVKRLSLFGSVARGDAGPDSDVDLVAELDRAARASVEHSGTTAARWRRARRFS